MNIWGYGRNLILVAGALAVSTVAEAQVATPDVSTTLPAHTGGNIPTDAWRFAVGLGLAVFPDYEGSEDYTGSPVPYARAQKGYQFAQLTGLKVTSNLIDDRNWRLGPMLNYRRGYNDVDNNQVDNLSNRGGSAELGFLAGYDLPFDTTVGEPGFVEFGGEFLFDVSSGHDGYVITPFARVSQPLSTNLRIVGEANFSYASGDYMSHYFSVNRDDANRSNLDEFDADADVKNVAFTLSTPYRIGSHWSLIPSLTYKRMTGDAEDSPVVDEAGNPNQFIAAIVGVYAW